MARKKKHEEHPDERWLLTYADVITLLFALFIVLFSISVVNKSKFDLVKESLASAFSSGLLSDGPAVLPHSTGDAPAPVTEAPPSIPIDIRPPSGVTLQNPAASAEQALETKQLEEVKERVEKAADAEGLKDKIQATVNERGLAIRLLTDGVLFDSGSAALLPEGARLLRPIAGALQGLKNPVRIEGHTDSRPIRTSQFPNNRWLGGGRAFAVADFFARSGVPDRQLRALSYGDISPVATNRTAEGRQQNRRVEVLVLRLQGAPGDTPASALGGDPASKPTP